MLRCGLLGETLGHSYSPMIHAQLGDYSYELFALPPAQLDAFLSRGEWDGLNVTIPYKKAVVPYCAELSDTARRLSSVNTLVRRADGTIFGDNTDYAGFSDLVRQSGIDVGGRKAIVLGNGGAAVTVCAVLHDLGAAQVSVISRRGEDNYTNLERHADAQIIVNTTPLGMYPNNGTAAVDLTRFPACEGVLDIVYNPTRTALILQAEALGIPCASGLYMLVSQARRSSERFTGQPIADERVAQINTAVHAQLQNIVLIGMPGSGKSTVAAALGQALNRPVCEADAMIEEKAGMTIPELFARDGETCFRTLETEVLRELGKRSGIILSTGGGCVVREENYPLLHQNGKIFWLRRDLDLLPSEGRPISQQTSMRALYAQREPLYARFADAKIDNGGSVEETVEQIKEALV